jgi:hypothetical protein
MKFMYVTGQEGNAGTTNGLYTFYSVLNMLFRKTVCPRDEDPTNISQFAKNLLANMRDGAPPLSVMGFVWEEIKDISLNSQKNCGFAPYLILIIEDAIGRNFPKEGKHMPFRPTPTKKPLISPAQVSHSSKSRSYTSVAANSSRTGQQHNSVRNLPPPSRNCLGSCLACVTLTMPSR